jgi:hypothetical protein
MPTAVLARPAAQPRFPIDEEYFVVQRVLLQLGRPKNLRRALVKKVSKHQYRVNIYCANDTLRPIKTASITDSFFVTLIGDEIVSNPTIARRYE